MLVNKDKEKTSKSKSRKDVFSKENIESMRSWIRKIEQTTNSISSRLSAVEKRVSGKKLESSDNSTSDSTRERSIEKILKKLKEGENGKGIEEIAKILDNELSLMGEEIISHENDISSLDGKLNTINETLAEINEKIKKLEEFELQISNDFMPRLELIERKEPPVMKIGKLEIPIEITGVVGGILAFIIAIFIIAGQNEIITSPLFLIFIGFVFIASALSKTFHIKTSISKFLKQTKTMDLEKR